MTTLTAAGQTALPIVEQSQSELVATWRRDLQAMLVFAATLNPTHERIERMRIWLDNHDSFDDKFAERIAQYDRESQTYLAQSSTLADMADQVNALQRRLSEESLQSLERDLSWPIADHLAMHLAVLARATGISDFETVLEAFMLDNEVVDVNRELCPF